MSTGPWGAWYHCMCNTYGTWVRGDSRGWRERHHRGHVEGDYRNPPQTGTYETTQAASRQSMKRDPVRLNRESGGVALGTILECLAEDGVLVLAACLDATHLHVLGRFKDLRPRRRLGWAKFFATKKVKEYLNAHGAAVGNLLELNKGHGLWGKRSQCVPIQNRQHRVQTLNYIARHKRAGALVWINPQVRGRTPAV